MRTLLVYLLFIGVACARDIAFAPVIDLDNPQTLAAIERDNPGHYARIEKVLAAAERMPANVLRDYVPAAVGASEINAFDLLMVSDPPKRSVWFTLDEAHYRATVVVAYPPAQLQPAR